MNRHKGARLLVLGLVGVALVCCATGWLLVGETLWTTGIDALFGQIYLTRESAPVPARKYISNELLLGGLPLADAVEGRLVLLPGEVYFWDPAYAGFPQTPLDPDEVEGLLTTLASAAGFTSPDTRQILCVDWRDGEKAEATACEAGGARREIHDEIRMTASMARTMAALQLHFPDGRLAEYRLFHADGMLAYSAVEVQEASIHGFITAGEDPLGALRARATVPRLEVLWPEDSAEVANGRAARRLGRRYQGGLVFLEGLQALHQAVGEVREIRPAVGENGSSDWMDGHSIQLLLRVLGDREEGVVRLRGGECWEAEMMVKGRRIDLTDGFVCPVD